MTERGDGRLVSGLEFSTPRELRASSPAEPRWVWEGYIARGWLTIVGGKPKVGKSTLLFACLEAIAGRSQSFLGSRTHGGPVVVITEESAVTALPKLSDNDDIRVLVREHAFPKPKWGELVRASQAEASRVGACSIIIDSFAFWAALSANDEKDSGASQAALEPLLEMAASGLAVVLVHHQRKAGGEDGDGFRGSNAITAAADMLVEIERVPAGEGGSYRRLAAVGRWPFTPGLLVVDYELTRNRWRVVGQGLGREDSRGIAYRDGLLRGMPNTEPGITHADLATVLGAQKNKWLSTLNELVIEGEIATSGKGVRGDPKRFWRPVSDSVPMICSPLRTETESRTPVECVKFHSSPLRGMESTHPAGVGDTTGGDEWESRDA